jgi:hypothetical protein
MITRRGFLKQNLGLGLVGLGCGVEAASTLQEAISGPKDNQEKSPGLDFIDTRFENASPLWYDFGRDGSNGQLHISRSPIAGLEGYLKRMANLERLLRKHTWFTEGSTGDSFRNSGTLGEGWLERFGIDAAVHEFNCNWIAGLKDYPSARHWQDYGAKLATVFYSYFGGV